MQATLRRQVKASINSRASIASDREMGESTIYKFVKKGEDATPRVFRDLTAHIEQLKNDLK